MTTFSQLEEIADDESKSFSVRRIAEALASAINDWPTYNLATLSDYIFELRKEVGDVLTLTNVRAKFHSYSFTGEDVWKKESLCGLLGAWDVGDGNVLLDELVRRIGLDI
ncbi:hypothetical protein [Pseudoduganella rhizocola]|uniref:hypothetical protein n=1 Tax=Pseudoduganella rhizocola TaxID=3382643 RepID=UPI0038B4FADE